jgi:hypothetical protein
VLTNGVVATTDITSISAGTVSDCGGVNGFSSSFLQGWNADSSIKIATGELSAESKGILQPLAPRAEGVYEPLSSSFSTFIGAPSTAVSRTSAIVMDFTYCFLQISTKPL